MTRAADFVRRFGTLGKFRVKTTKRGAWSLVDENRYKNPPGYDARPAAPSQAHSAPHRRVPKTPKAVVSPLEKAWKAWQGAVERDYRLKYGGKELEKFMRAARSAGVDPSVANLDFEAKHPRHPAGSPNHTGGEFAPKAGNWRVTKDGRVIRVVKKAK